ncbi:hypothetical protein IFR05_016664 [Cadophora sp. M221]|nr:hypothetical protein IFR05_016664 [Cadophora sp. M221]
MILNYIPKSGNPYLDFVTDQKFALFSSFELDSGVVIDEVVIAYKTWGQLNGDGTNCLVICHALSGSSDVEDWWGPLLSRGEAFDTSRYFVFCANVLGSPYGTTSSLSVNPRTGQPYGPKFPQTTIRDDIRLHKKVLDVLGVRSVAAVVGGSMGGMATLEWPLCNPEGYIKNIIPLSTSVDHDAWGTAWAEAQRACVFADPSFEDGFYKPTPATQPTAGLAAARMVAMLTYRSAPSFNTRFGRGEASTHNPTMTNGHGVNTNGVSHNTEKTRRDSKMISHLSKPQIDTSAKFKAHSYLQYQGQKFVNRFDANCFIHLTRKMDLHDITSGRIDPNPGTSRSAALSGILSKAPRNALVIGMDSDMLFRPEQQGEIADALLDARLVMVGSREGHDGFLLEFEILGPLIERHLRERLPWVYEGEPIRQGEEGEVKTVRDSVFGEVESGW